MADLVRARTEDGEEINVSRSLAERSPVLEVLDEPAWAAFNKPRHATRSGGRRAKPKTTVAKQAAAKKAVTESAGNEGDNQ